jgi:hypothetical protein
VVSTLLCRIFFTFSLQSHPNMTLAGYKSAPFLRTNKYIEAALKRQEIISKHGPEAVEAADGSSMLRDQSLTGRPCRPLRRLTIFFSSLPLLNKLKLPTFALNWLGKWLGRAEPEEEASEMSEITRGKQPDWVRVGCGLGGNKLPPPVPVTSKRYSARYRERDLLGEEKRWLGFKKKARRKWLEWMATLELPGWMKS